MARRITLFSVALTVLAAALGAAPARGAEPVLSVVTTVSDLGSLARRIGGERVSVFVLAGGTEDAHHVTVRPSFVRNLQRADLFVLIGLDNEHGWVPRLLRASRNPRIQPGQPGYLDASTGIEAMEVIHGPITRDMGHVHAAGNPHYLVDPIEGLRVAKLLATRMGQLRPSLAGEFEQRYVEFDRELRERFIGEELAAKYDLKGLADLYTHGHLEQVLEERGELEKLGGWLADVRSCRGTRVVVDHGVWPYFARRFGIQIAGFLEPKPGMAPTTRHLQGLIQQMKNEGIRLILAVPYFDQRHASFVSQHTGARVLPMAHQVDSRPGTQNYIAMIDYNVRQLVEGIRASR